MKLTYNKFQRPLSTKGVTLVELMIAVALGLLLTAGAISIFVSSKQIYRTEDAMSRNQENGRFITDFLARKIRMAGFTGCSNLEELEPVVIADPAPIGGFSFDSALIGYEGNGTNKTKTWVNPSTIVRVAGTDIVTIGSGGECGADLTGNMDTVNANIQIAGGGGDCGFEANDYLLLTDCETADLFRASSVSEASGKITVAHAENVNTENFLSKTYQAGSGLYHFQQTTYFIGTAPSGNPSLYRILHKDPLVTQELIENVQDMQFLYGVDTGVDGVIDVYQDASDVDDWARVLGARISLLLRSDEDNVTMQPQTITFNGASVNTGPGADHRLRTVFNSTVTVRNRVP
ncbi:MAG: PilW family protein [Pseudomonadota bacterium]